MALDRHSTFYRAAGIFAGPGGTVLQPRRRCGRHSPAWSPVRWLMRLPWPQAVTTGKPDGYQDGAERIDRLNLSKLGPDALDSRSRLIMLYAMCGFANFGGLGMAPERRDEINSLGLKSIVGGTLTTCLMGSWGVELNMSPSFRGDATRRTMMRHLHISDQRFAMAFQLGIQHVDHLKLFLVFPSGQFPDSLQLIIVGGPDLLLKNAKNC